MTQEASMSLAEQPVRKKSWIPYVLICFALIILLGILFPAATDPGIPASILKAGSMARQVQTGCLAYLTEYGTLPSTSENYRLVKILVEDNPRKIAFLNVKSTDLSPNGDLMDSWGIPYRITFDGDSNIRVISAGPDKIFGTADDISNQQ